MPLYNLSGEGSLLATAAGVNFLVTLILMACPA